MEIEVEIKTKFINEHHRASLNLMFTSNWMIDQTRDTFKEFAITSQQYNVLRILRGRNGNPCSCGDIKEVMLDKTPDLTRLLDRMLDRRWVTREVCPNNRRQMDVQITMEGLKLLERMAPVVMAVNEDFKKKITKKEATELSRILDKMRN